ncbi:unnamed protein product [Moneuplotes crassus]|uniref:Uncharacterized protein n=1 Tax=Euplotes crassus TaxID=5936 RepID=A0AAD1UFC7_EUPCR|nr:unnamed protein product [Moneuplotes crassus]
MSLRIRLDVKELQWIVIQNLRTVVSNIASHKSELEKSDPKKLRNKNTFSSAEKSNKINEISHYKPNFSAINPYINCKKQYDHLEKELEHSLKQAQELLGKPEEQKSILVDESANREDRIRYEENIHQESEDIDRQVLSSIEFKTLLRNQIRLCNFVLRLDFNFDKHFKVLKSLDSLVLPNLRELKIENLNRRKPPALKRFLKNSFPRRVENLFLSFFRANSINMDKYLREILHASYKVQSIIVICCIDISLRALVRLFSACRNKEQVIFVECYIDVEKVPDFGHSLDGSTISSISFLSCKIYGQQGIRLSGFSNLVEGFSKSQDFKKSLKTILVSQSVLRRPYCNILSEFGFDKTSVRVIKY